MDGRGRFLVVSVLTTLYRSAWCLRHGTVPPAPGRYVRADADAEKALLVCSYYVVTWTCPARFHVDTYSSSFPRVLTCTWLDSTNGRRRRVPGRNFVVFSARARDSLRQPPAACICWRNTWRYATPPARARWRLCATPFLIDYKTF